MQIKLSIEKNCEAKKVSIEEIYIEINKASIEQIDVAQFFIDPRLRTTIMDYNINF